jgi:ribonuclease HII
VAAVALDLRGISAISDLGDSKALTAPVREACYQQIVSAALAWSVVVIPAADIDRLGLHVCNVTGMRRALACLASRPGYVLTDGFPVRGLAVPALAMWKGDQVAACVAAASVIAKVTRDRMMRALDPSYPEYGFARHKGYSTPSHMRALAEYGPCHEHRRSFANVRLAGNDSEPAGLPDLLASPDLPASPDLRNLPAGAEFADLDSSLSAAGLAGLAAGATGGQPAGDNGGVVDLTGDHARPDQEGFADDARGA